MAAIMQEQIDEDFWWHLKAAWQKFGLWITLVFAAIVAAATIGWYWQHHQEQQIKLASNLYHEYLELREKDPNNTEQILAKIALLKEQVPSSPYAALAVLYQAKIAVNMAEKIAAYDWILQNQAKGILANTTVFYLANAYFAHKDYQQVLSVIDQYKNLLVEDSPYASLLYEIKGDALLQLKNYAAAKQAYQEAEKLQGNVRRPLLHIKLEQFE